MALSKEIQKKICDFVYLKPRTIQEIAEKIGKNWRTADAYVEKIAEEEGVLSVRTFRGGTKGALKIVYWSNTEKIHSQSFQERLFKQIESGRNKTDFSPSEIYQYVDPEKRKAVVLTDKQFNSKENFNNFKSLLESAENQILFFSGNISFGNIGSHDRKIKEVIKDLAEKNIPSKVLTRVEIPGLDNVKELLAINDQIGKEIIEVRHCFQPLRLTIVDNKVAVFKETQDPKDYAPGELKEKITTLYWIYDEEWINWLQKVFFNLFRVSIPAQKRIEDFKSIKDAV